MLRHAELYDPIEKMDRTNEIDFDKYVEIHKKQTALTDPILVEDIKRRFYGVNSEAETGNLDKIWEFVGPKVEQNTGLAEFIKDYNGADSEYFFPWLVNVFKSPATALEISYGAGPNLDGIWKENIQRTDDPIVPFIRDDPAFVYNRERQLRIADLVSTYSDMYVGTSRLLKVVDFGAGRMSWARRHGYQIWSNIAQIYAFDRDPSIDPEEVFGRNSYELEKIGIKYKHADFTNQLTNPDLRDADLIILGGVACYIPSEIFVGKIIPAIYMLLKPNGAFLFDLQTTTPCYRHSMDILDWPEINLPDNPSIVVDSVEKARESLWEKGIKFSAEYAIDTYNKIPSAVMIILQKV